MSTPYSVDIQKMYIAYFGRPADAVGLEYWSYQTNLAGGDPKAVINAFSASPEYAYNYAGETSSYIVNQLYVNLFGREAEADGLEYWTERLDNGTFDIGNIAWAIMVGAQNEDMVTLNNKAEAAAAFTEAHSTSYGVQSYRGDAAAEQAQDWLSNVSKDASSVAEAVNILVSTDVLIPMDPTVFTLKQAEISQTTLDSTTTIDPVISTTVMWKNGEVDCPDCGVPFDTITGLLTTNFANQTALLELFDFTDDLAEIENITVAGAADDTQVSGDAGSTVGDTGDGSTVEVGDVNSSGDYTGNYEITISLSDESTLSTQVELTQQQIDLLNSILFDAEGNTRLYTAQTKTWPQVNLLDEDGENVLDADSEPILVNLYEYTVDGETITTAIPLVLTPTQNNGSTEEELTLTTDGNDLIVAGRLDLLHGAYIDGGEGINTLEIDAKGHFAQPKQLLNIQNINIENLPNIYTVEADNANQYPDVVDGSDAEGNSNSIIDLSRAIELEKLTITEGLYTNLDTEQINGDLTVTGVRADATLILEGSFTQDVNVFYSQGMGTNDEGLNLVLRLGETNDMEFDILGNSATVNIDSQGGGNAIDATFSASSLTNMNISGDARLQITSNLTEQFQPNTPAVIDASANTAGVDLTITAFSDEVQFTGSSADDHLNANNNDKEVIANLGDGNDEITANDSVIVTINAGSGNNEISATTAELVTISANDGHNTIDVSSSEVANVTLGNGNNTVDASNTAQNLTLVAGDGDNSITADDSAQASLILGDGANTISALTVATLNVEAGNGGNQITVTENTQATITTGSGNDTISATAANTSAESVTIDAGEGDNSISVSGYETVTVTAASGDDALTIVGGNIDLGSANGVPTELDGENENETFINVDLGAGENTLTLGSDDVNANAGVTAMAGSTITGENITLNIQSNTDLTQAAISGISAVNLGNGDILTLSVDQFTQMGGSTAFSVIGEEFGGSSVLNIVVDKNTSLDDLNIDDLPRNIDLSFEIKDGVTLQMSAQQLHERVTDGGVTMFEDGENTDFAPGTVFITDAGVNFDAFDTGLKGSVDEDSGLNIRLDAKVNGYERPADYAVYTRISVDSDADLVNGVLTAFATDHTFLRITGESDVTMEAVVGDLDGWGNLQTPMSAITLGGGIENFKVDFSSVTGSVEGLVFANFENADAIYGNGGARVDVELTDDVGAPDAGLLSKGVQTYVVTDMNDDSHTFYTCETTQDLATLGLQGNYGETITFANTERGVNFLMEVEYDKTDGYAVGTVVAEFARPTGATANFDIVGLSTLPAGETQLVDGIETNATAMSIDVEGGNTKVESITAANATSLTLNADANLEIQGTIPASLEIVNASGVVADLAISTATDGDFAFTGSAGATTLTLSGELSADDAVSFTSAGTLEIVADADQNFTNIDLSDVSSLVINDTFTVTMTIDQAVAMTATNISGDGSLTLSGLGEQPFVYADFEDFSVSGDIVMTDQASITLNVATDLTGVESLIVSEGTTLTMTAAQFQAFDGVITGDATTDYTVVIDGLTQADVDNGFDLTGITGNVTVNLAESIIMPNNGSMANADVINMTDADMTLTVQTFEELDGVEINGGTNSVVKFVDSTIDTNDYPSIDASGFSISEVHFLNLVADDINIDEQLFVNLPETVTKVVYNGEGMATPVSQTVTIQAQSSIDGDYIAFNKSGEEQDTIEIVDFTINLEGGVNIAGDIELSTAPKDNDFTNNELLKQGLKVVTINSTGTAENFFTGETTNIMGVLTPRGDNVAAATDNTLTTVVINASQALEMAGIEFNSWSENNADEADGWTINDNDAATATVTVNGDADVDLGDLDSSDTEVVAVVVNNTGTGTVTATISNTLNGTDALSFTGSNIVLNVSETMDLSNDDLSGVTTINLQDQAEITLSQAQVEALGTTSIVLAEGDEATLNINAFDGAVAFDATAFNEDLTVDTITMTAGTHTLTGDFTGVDTIVVPEGGVLNLTAAQFNQIGAIVSFDTDGENGAEEITVNITDFMQADAADFDSTKVDTTHTVTLAMAEDITLDANSDIENIDTLIMADTQTLSLVNSAQADALVTSSTGTTTINLEFDVSADAGSIDASGYDVDTLRVWSTAVDNTDVENTIDNLPNSVTLNIMESGLQIDTVADVHRTVVIEAGVDVPSFLVFNGDDIDRELVTLNITFSGDATDRTEQEDFDDNINGSIISGNLVFDLDPTYTGDNLDIDYFQTLTLNSTGTGSSNAIEGDISPLDADGVDVDGDGDNTNNNLTNVVINAEADFTITGAIHFNGVTPSDDTANLTINNDADVSIGQLIVNGANIDVLNVANNGTGTLTITGASPAVDSVSLEAINFTGTGDIVLGTVGEGIDGDSVVSSINASTLTGDLTLDEVSALDSANFAMTAGTGVTTVTLTGNTLDAAGATDTGFSFDFSNAAELSEIRIDDNTWTAGDLNIDLGANTTLYIDADTDLSALDLSITQTNDIVLADGVELTLTAAQANGLNIVGAKGAESTGVVNIVDLGTAAYDLSGIDAAIAGTTYLADTDVTLDATTDLGSFSVTLIDSDDTATPMLGQTIRFQDETQAARTIIVEADAAGDLGDTGVDADTNVVWLFDTITDSVDTGTSGITPVYDYSADLGRLWVTPELLANNNNIEELFTTLPSTILRVEFGSLEDLNFALGSNGFDRSVEMVAFTDLSATGLVFNDEDRYEHIESLTLSLGGEVNTGDIALDNIIAASADPLELDPTGITFNTITINSHLVDDQDHFLAPEGFVNDGDGTNDQGEHRLPNAINTVGDISVGANNGLDLTAVTLNAIEADLTVGTITFDSEVENTTATLTVEGTNDIEIKSLDTSDADIDTLTVDATLYSGTLTVTGGSPAAAVANSETLIIELGGIEAPSAEVDFGTEQDTVNGVPYAGVAGAELSTITIDRTDVAMWSQNNDFAVNLGTIAQVDGNEFTLNGNGEAEAIMGTANVNDVLMAPELLDGGTWTINDTVLTFSEDVTLGAGNLTLDEVTLTIDGDVDFTTLAELTLTDTTIEVPAGSSLTILAEDIDGVTVTGDGVVNVMALEATTDADLSNVMTADGDTGTVEATVTTDAAADVDFTGELGKAHVTISGDGIFDVTGATLDTAAFDHDDDDTNADEVVMSTFTVNAGSTLELDADQVDDRTVDGDGATELELFGAPDDVNLANIETITVNAAVSDDEEFDKDANFGTAVITVAATKTLTVIGETVDGLTVAGTDATVTVNDADLDGVGGDDAINADFSNFTIENITFVDDALIDSITFPELYGDPEAVPAQDVQTVTMTSVQADGQTIVGATPGVTGAVIVAIDDTVDGDLDGDVDAFSLANINAGTMTATINDTDDDVVEFDSAVDFGNFDIVITAGDVVIMTAAQANGLSITETGAATIDITKLEDTPDADLSGVVVTNESANLDADGDVALSANLGADMTVNVTDSNTSTDGVPGTVTFTGTMDSTTTTFNLDDSVSLVLDANDAHELTVTDENNNGENVVVNNVDGDEINLGNIEATVEITANVPADATLDTNTDLAHAQVVLAEGVTLGMDFTQFDSIGAADIVGTTGGTVESIVINDYDGSLLASDDLDPTVNISVLNIEATEGTTTIDPASDLSKVQSIVIPEAQALEMSADQFEQLPTGAISGAGRLHITNFDSDNTSIDLSTVTALAGTIYLDATDVNGIVLDPNADLGDFDIKFTATNQSFTFSSETQADGRTVEVSDVAHTGQTIILGFTNADATDADAVIDASNYSGEIENLFVLNTFIENEFGPTANFEEMLENLNDNITVTVYDNDTLLDANLVNPTSVIDETARKVVIDSDTTLSAGIAFNDFATDGVLDEDVVVNTLELTLSGNSVITGNLQLAQDVAPLTSATAGNIPNYFDTLTINSTGTGTNEIQGNISADDGTDGALSESRLEVFTLTLDPAISVDGGDDQIEFDGRVIDLNDTDNTSDIGAALAGTTYSSYTAAYSEAAATLSLDQALTDGNLSVTIDGTTYTEAFDTNHATTMANLEAALETDGYEVSVAGNDLTIDRGNTSNALNVTAFTTDDSAAVASNSFVADIVTYTHEHAGNATDVAIGDFTFNVNGVATSGLPGTSAIAKVQDGAFNASENSLYDINIQADTDLVISGELELSYLTRGENLNETVTATIDIEGDADVTIGSVNTDDEHITGLTLTHTGTGTVTAPGTSPGAALGNTETLTIETTGTVILGTDGDATKPGVSGDDLSTINLGGDGTIDVGVVESFDTSGITINVADDTTATATFGPSAGNLSMTGNISVNATAGTAGNTTIAVQNITMTDGTTMDLNGADDAVLDNVVFDAGSTIDVTNLNSLDVTGTTDLTQAAITGTLPTITVAAGETLTLTPQQADGVTITGEGDVVITSLDSATLAAAPLGGTIDLSGIMTTAGDTGTVTIAIDSTGNMDLGASDIGIATLNITGTGIVDASSATVAPVDRNDPATAGDLTDDAEPSFTVDALSTLNITATQAGEATGTPEDDWNLTVTGAGTTTVENLWNNPDADLSGIATTTATAVTDGVTFTGDLGSVAVTVNDANTLIAAYSVVAGKTINEGPLGTGALEVQIPAADAAADLSTIVGDMDDAQISAVVTETQTFTGDFNGHDVEVEDGVDLTVSADRVDGVSVTGLDAIDNDGADDANIIITDLATNLAVDLSGITITNDDGTATAAFDADGTFTGDLGTVTVTIADDVTMTAGATVLVGADVRKSGVAANGAVVVTVSSADNNYDSDNADGDNDTATGTFEEVDLDLDNIAVGANGADITSITVTEDVTFIGTLNTAQATLVADGATLSTIAAIANASGQNIDKVAGGTDGSVALDASLLATGDSATIAGSADYTVTGLIGTIDGANVTGDLDVTAAADAAVTVNLGSGTNTIDATALLNGQVMNVTDSANHEAGATIDTVNGDVTAATITNHDGNSATGGVTITGGNGANTLTGSANNDIIDGSAGADIINGGDGDDTFIIDNGADISTDSYTGGAGTDVLDINTIEAVDFSNATIVDSMQLDLSGYDTDVTFQADDFANIDLVTGEDLNDSITINALDGATVALNTATATHTLDFLATDTGVSITNFTTGVDGDILDFTDLFGGAAVAGSTADETLANTAAQVGVDSTIYFNTTTSIDGKDYSAANFAEIFSDPADGDADVIFDTRETDADYGAGGGIQFAFIMTDNNNSTPAQLYFVDTTLDGISGDISAADVTLVGTIEDVDNTSTFVDTNFA